jgi:hypothetical protein
MQYIAGIAPVWNMDAIMKYYCNGFVFDATVFFERKLTNVKTPCVYVISELLIVLKSDTSNE